MKRPSFGSHLIALMMPITMCVLVPLWLLRDHQDGLALRGAWQAIGVALAIGGLLLFVWTLRLFIAVGRGTLAPWDPTKKLVIRGPYRYCRNPMISGVLCIIVGEAIYFQSLAVAMWALAFFGVNTIYFKLKEEPDLARKFGREYLDYKSRVNRWLPKLKPYN